MQPSFPDTPLQHAEDEPDPELAEPLSRFKTKLEGYLDDRDIEFVIRAYHHAKAAHRGKNRMDGKPYITHPLAVADILADMHLDREALGAALLHDTIEDTNTKTEEIDKAFGSNVANIVEGVSKLVKTFESRLHRQAESIFKMILATTKDPRVILVKMADRLHNMRTLEYLPREKHGRITRETLEVYVRMANRLGLSRITAELEDLCMRFRYPRLYDKIRKDLQRIRQENIKDQHKNLIDEIRQELKSRKIDATVIPQERNFYSIHKKCRKISVKGARRAFETVARTLSCLILVKKDTDCYLVLGILHQRHKLITDLFRDYISIPKPNGYQSLHTEVLTDDGMHIEIHIRTKKMNEVANYGLTSFMELDKPPGNLSDRAYGWLPSLKEIISESKGGFELIKNLQTEWSDDQIQVFTPRGKVIFLPLGATALDFAYEVHTELGNTCIGCLVDQERKPLSTRLEDCQTIEILTDPAGHNASKAEWLNFVITSKARKGIKQARHARTKEMLTAYGLSLLEKNLQWHFKTRFTDICQQRVARVLGEIHLHDLDSLLIQIGEGNQIPYIIALLLSEDPLFVRSRRTTETGASLLERIRGGIPGAAAINRALCCQPVVGSAIVGLIVDRRQMIVHVETCDTLRKERDLHSSRLIVPLSWKNGS